MFDLEQAIAQWRKQMLAAGIKSTSLEELESHLRDEIERVIGSGLTEQAAFDISTHVLGQPKKLKKEFSKINPPGLNELMKNPKLVSRLSLAVVLLATAWLAFSAVMIGKDLFMNDGLIPMRVSDGAQVMVQNGTPVLQGSGVISAGEKYQTALIPALAIPFAVLVTFAVIGCRSLLRKGFDERPPAELLVSNS